MKVTVKAARIMAGLTQRQAAEKLGVSRNTYAWIEKHPERVTIERATALCDVLGVSMEDVSFLPTPMPEA